MHFGNRSSWGSPHDAACSSRAPSSEREHPHPGQPLRPECQDGGEVAQAHHDSRPIEEAIVVEFRRRTLLPLDDVLGCLRETIPKLSRSALHRCLARHGISQLPRIAETAAKRGRFAETTIGYVHIDVCELRCAEGKVHMFLAIDRV